MGFSRESYLSAFRDWSVDGIQRCGSAILGPVLAHVHAKTWEWHDNLHYTSTAVRITTALIAVLLHTVRGVTIMPITE